MKTLASAGDKDAVRSRIGSLAGTDRGLWGRMNVHQMVCHLNDSFLLALGQRPATENIRFPLPLFLLKWGALKTPFPWPRGAPTLPGVDQEKGGTPPEEFAADRESLLSSFNRFCLKSQAWPPHPIFGPLTNEEWMRWGYLHCDHHLRQFGR